MIECLLSLGCQRQERRHTGSWHSYQSWFHNTGSGAHTTHQPTTLVLHTPATRANHDLRWYQRIITNYHQMKQIDVTRMNLRDHWRCFLLISLNHADVVIDREITVGWCWLEGDARYRCARPCTVQYWNYWRPGEGQSGERPPRIAACRRKPASVATSQTSSTLTPATTNQREGLCQVLIEHAYSVLM